MTTEKGLGKNSWEKEKERDGNTARKKYSKRERERVIIKSKLILSQGVPP